MGLPQVTSDPSARIAANAPFVAWTCWTPFSWSWTTELSPPESGSPQVTTDPSARIAANAKLVAWTCWTPFSWSWTTELSPPLAGSPKSRLTPSARIAANALNEYDDFVAWTCWTPFSWCWTWELSPPWAGQPQVTTDPSARSQQRHIPLLEPAGHLWVDLGPQSCHHQRLVAPSHDWPICQDRSKCLTCSLNLLDTLQLMLDFRAITTIDWFAPSHEWPIGQDRSKCKVRCLNLLDTFWVDLGPQSCHHQSLVRPKSRLTHLPGSQQRHISLLEPTGHLSADLGLQSHHQLQGPMSQLGHLQSKTRQTFVLLLPVLPPGQQPSDGLHPRVPQLAETL